MTIEQDLETIQFGPKMAALSEKRRALVVALFDDDAPARGAGTFAARRAGYGTATSDARSLKTIASRIIHDDAVQEAIKEHSHRVMRAIPPEAIRALKKLIADPTHPQHMRAIAVVLTAPIRCKPCIPSSSKKIAPRHQKILPRS